MDSKLVTLDNGNYRAFMLIKYPVTIAYENTIQKIEKSPELKSRLTNIQNTDAYKELQEAVSKFSNS